MSNSIEIVFLSNFLLHHQTEFCENMDRITGGKFRFVATAPITQERLNLGYHDYSQMDIPYYIEANSNNDKIILDMVKNAKAVIIGSAPWRYIEQRIYAGGLTYIYSEKIFKTFVGSVKAILKGTVHKRFVIPGKMPHVKLLCASAYLPNEMNLFHAFPNRMYRWAYFPPYETLDINKKEAISDQKKIKLLWVGRMIPYKRPMYPVRLAKYLKKRGIDCEIEMIGTGKLLPKIQNAIKKYGLADALKVYDAMSPEEVRAHMVTADIFMFTSNSEEGWGAVLNEAMNSGCAVVASHRIGSVPYLLTHCYNGLIYRDGDFRSFCSCIIRLLHNRVMITEMGKQAYATIRDEWNAVIGAERLNDLIDGEINANNVDYSGGPCSKAYSVPKYQYLIQ